MPRINPPGPRYTIPSGTVGLVSRFDFLGSRRHRTRSELRFAYPYCFHGPENPVFQVKRDWLFAVPLRGIKVRDYRVIAALIFSLEGSGHQRLIAWSNDHGNSLYARPKRRSHTTLDVRAGQEIEWYDGRRQRELVVTAVRIYRCNRHGDNSRIIDCGRAWLRESDGSR